MEYTKPPLTYEQQVELLINRGLIVDDKERAIRLLGHISYYRLSAYMLPFKKLENNNYLNQFKEGTRWDDVYNLYLFDRKLRLLVFDAIERIEISIRTQITYQLSHKYGSHWQMNADIFKLNTRTKNGKIITIDVHKELCQHINEQLKSNQTETFVQHYINIYDTPVMPPSWMCTEIMYFNQLSRICMSLKSRKDLVDIANVYSLPPAQFCSWLHTINYVRNLCAHHSRLWNRDFNIVPQKLNFSKKLHWISNTKCVQSKKTYYFLCIINFTQESNFMLRNAESHEASRYVNYINCCLWRKRHTLYNPDTGAFTDVMHTPAHISSCQICHTRNQQKHHDKTQQISYSRPP